MDPDVFNLVYEGFWDLYTLRPKVNDIRTTKLLTWIEKIKLISGPERPDDEPTGVDDPAAEDDKMEAAGEEGAEENNEVEKPATATDPVNIGRADEIDPFVALVRLKIPKVPLEPELNEEGQEIPVDVLESDLEDIPFEDKCL